MWTYCNRMVRHQFGQFGRSFSQGLGEMFKIFQLVPHSGGDLDTVLVGVTEAFLQQREEPPAAWDANSHATQFSQDFMPKLDRHASLSAK